MNKRAVRAIGVAVAAGVLFLQAVMAGGVASEEMGMVMDAMRSLRRSKNLYYELTSFHTGEETTQKIWVDLLTEQWVEELALRDDDGLVVSWERYFDRQQEWMRDEQGGWELSDSDSGAPGLSTITEFSLGVDDIEETKRLEEDGYQKVIFTIADELCEKYRQEILAVFDGDEYGAGVPELAYQQYADTRFDNVVITYTIDEKGLLAEIDFSMDVTQPELLLKGGGVYELGEDETYQLGYTAKVIAANTAEVTGKITECAAAVEELD